MAFKATLLFQMPYKALHSSLHKNSDKQKIKIFPEMFQSVNYKTIVIATLLVGLFSALSCLGAWAHVEGGSQIIIKLLYYFCYIFAFPFLYIFYGLNIVNLSSGILAMTLDSIFYAFIIERLIWRSKIKKTKI